MFKFGGWLAGKLSILQAVHAHTRSWASCNWCAVGAMCSGLVNLFEAFEDFIFPGKMFVFTGPWLNSQLHIQALTFMEVATPVRGAFSYGIWHVFIVIQWTVTHSLENHNMPYPVWKCLPYGSINYPSPPCKNLLKFTGKFLRQIASGWFYKSPEKINK